MTDLDLMNCQSRSRCPTCHHFDAATGCGLLALVDAYEATQRAPVPPAKAPALAWVDTRGMLRA